MTVDTPPRPPRADPAPAPDVHPTKDTGRPVLAVLPWIVAVVALVVAGFSTWRWLDLQAQADARDDVAVVSNAFLTDLVNWDASDGLDDTVTALRAQGTGRFLAQVEDLFGGSIGDELEVAEATSEGSVEDLFVQSLQDGRAEVFAVVRQTVRSTRAEPTGPTIRRVIMQLERADGAWRIENLELPELVRQTPNTDGEG